MRSSRLLLVLGLLVAAAAAVFVFVLMSGGGGGLTGGSVQVTPTPPDVEVLVARVDLPVNTVISDTNQVREFFRNEPVPAGQAGNYVAAADMTVVVNKKLVTDIAANQPLRPENLGELGLAQIISPGTVGLSVMVDPLSGVGGLIAERDHVDVLASFPLEILYIRPGIESTTSGAGDVTQGSLELVLREDIARDHTTKVLLQDVEVARVLQRPPGVAGQPGQPGQGTVNEEGTPVVPPTPVPGRDADPNALQAGLQPHQWIVILALTQQQAEVVKYAVDKGGIMTLALRGTGDTEQVTTTGMTFDILVRDFGVAIPRPLDLLRVQLQGAQQTPTLPTPIPPTALTPTPTP